MQKDKFMNFIGALCALLFIGAMYYLAVAFHLLSTREFALLLPFIMIGELLTFGMKDGQVTYLTLHPSENHTQAAKRLVHRICIGLIVIFIACWLLFGFQLLLMLPLSYMVICIVSGYAKATGDKKLLYVLYAILTLVGARITLSCYLSFDIAYLLFGLDITIAVVIFTLIASLLYSTINDSIKSRKTAYRHYDYKALFQVSMEALPKRLIFLVSSSICMLTIWLTNPNMVINAFSAILFACPIYILFYGIGTLTPLEYRRHFSYVMVLTAIYLIAILLLNLGILFGVFAVLSAFSVLVFHVPKGEAMVFYISIALFLAFALAGYYAVVSLLVFAYIARNQLYDGWLPIRARLIQMKIVKTG